MIRDPSVSKPADWVDEPLMDDPEDVKPADYDNTPKEIPDPEAEKPEDWDDEVSDGDGWGDGTESEWCTLGSAQRRAG